MHAAFTHDIRLSIGYCSALVRMRAAPSCWCISSLARGLSYLSTYIQTCRQLGEPVEGPYPADGAKSATPHRQLGSKGVRLLPHPPSHLGLRTVRAWSVP